MLATTNKQVDAMNKARYAKHKGKAFRNKAWLTGSMKPADVLAPVDLQLKEGCRVLLIANNQDEGFVNGMTGVFDGLGDRDWETPYLCV